MSRLNYELFILIALSINEPVQMTRKTLRISRVHNEHTVSCLNGSLKSRLNLRCSPMRYVPYFLALVQIAQILQNIQKHARIQQSFARKGPTLTTFSLFVFYEGREGPNSTKSDDPTLNACLVAL